MKKFSIIGISLLGKVRKRNEDSFVFTDDLSKRNQLAVITDGIGGCGHGDTASRFICELFYQEFEKQKAAESFTLYSGLSSLSRPLRSLSMK